MKITFNNRRHVWEKMNLVTDSKGNDTYKCKLCGLKGKRIGLDDCIVLPDKISNSFLAKYCIDRTDNYVGKNILIISCFANGTQFANILNGTQRMVVCVRFCHAHTLIQSTKANWQN